MNGFTEPRASGASERPGQGDLVLTWDSSHAMLPLVGRIASDIVAQHERLAKLQPEQARLERNRRTLDWAGRSRRYQIQEELIALDKGLAEAVGELAGLGVVLLDGSIGLVGFPTMVNDRRAYFSWRPGEENLKYWNFADETARHPVPESWTRPTREMSSKGRSRPQK
jgi:hypothetical protein